MLQSSKGQMESHCFVPGKIKLLSLVESAEAGLNAFLLPVLPSDGDFRVWGRPSDRWIRHRRRRTTLLDTRAPKYFILELIFSLLSSSSLFFTKSRVRITQTMLVENIISFFLVEGKRQLVSFSTSCVSSRCERPTSTDAFFCVWVRRYARRVGRDAVVGPLTAWLAACFVSGRKKC